VERTIYRGILLSIIEERFQRWLMRDVKMGKGLKGRLAAEVGEVPARQVWAVLRLSN